MKGAAWGAALLVSALAILPFLPTLGSQFLNSDDGINFVTNPGFRGLGWAPLLRRVLRLDQSLDGARRDPALALDGEAEVSRRQGDVAEAERLRQEAIEARAAMPTAKRPVEIPGRDRERTRP